jgi:hypothetical protein
MNPSSTPQSQQHSSQHKISAPNPSTALPQRTIKVQQLHKHNTVLSVFAKDKRVVARLVQRVERIMHLVVPARMCDRVHG